MVKKLKITFKLKGAWEEWVAEVPDDTDLGFPEEVMDNMDLIGITDSGNTYMDIDKIEELDE